MEHARELQEQALSIALEVGNKRGEGNALNYLGKIYTDLGQTKRALDPFEKALTIARETAARRLEGNVLSNLSELQHILGDEVEAISKAEEALCIFSEIEYYKAAEIREKLDRWHLNS